MTVRRFLAARYATMLAWVVLLIAAVVSANEFSARLGSPWGPIVWVLIVGAAVAIGLAAQRVLIARLDPTGRLRDEIHPS